MKGMYGKKESAGRRRVLKERQCSLMLERSGEMRRSVFE
jgi:hypothetical protein